MQVIKSNIRLRGGVNPCPNFPGILIYPGNLSGNSLKTIPDQEQKRTGIIAARSGEKLPCGTVLFFVRKKRRTVHQNCRAALSG